MIKQRKRWARGIIFILAPIMFALFDFRVVDCTFEELLMFWRENPIYIPEDSEVKLVIESPNYKSELLGTTAYIKEMKDKWSTIFDDVKRNIIRRLAVAKSQRRKQARLDIKKRVMFTDGNTGTRMVLKDTNMGKHMLINASKLASYKGTESVFVSANDVSDVLNLLKD